MQVNFGAWIFGFCKIDVTCDRNDMNITSSRQKICDIHSVPSSFLFFVLDSYRSLSSDK